MRSRIQSAAKMPTVVALIIRNQEEAVGGVGGTGAEKAAIEAVVRCRIFVKKRRFMVIQHNDESALCCSIFMSSPIVEKE